MNPISKKQLIILIVLVSILPFLPLLFGYFPAIGDMRDVFIPLETFFRSQQLQGQIPAWDPSVSFGFPVIASAQIGFFYPILFLLRFLPIWIELPIALISHVALCAVGMFLFAKRFKISNEAAILTALSFSLSQFLWQHLTHLNIFLAVAWLPWQMYAVDILFRKNQIQRRGMVALTVLFGIPFLIGQIQVPFLMMAVCLVYAICLRLSNPLQLPLRKGEGTSRRIPLLTKEGLGEVMPTIRAIIVISLTTFFLASVQLLPTLELSRLSSRATPEGFDIKRANQHSYPIYHLPTYLFPKFYGTDNTYWGKRLEIEYGTYIGVIPLLLAVWYFVQRKRVPFSPIGEKVQPAFVRDADEGSSSGITSPYPNPLPNWGEGSSRTPFFLFLLIVSFLLSFGDMSPFRLIGLEPSLWFFSAPARWLLFTTFSLSLFAGFGFDAIWENRDKAKEFFSKIAFLIIGLIISGNILLVVVSPLPNWGEGKGEGWFNQISQKNQDKLHSLLVSAQTSGISLSSPYTYIVIISLWVLPYALTNKNGKQILLSVVILDLVIIAGTTVPLVSWKSILAEPVTVKSLPVQVKNNQARIYSLRDGGDTGAYFTDPSSRADTAKRQLQKDLLVPMVSSQFGIYGIEWPASLDLTEQGAVLERLHPTKPYAVEDTELASELTIGAVLSPAENGGVDITPLESKARFELVTSPPAAPREASERSWDRGAPVLEIISKQPSEIIFKTTSEKDTTLIVRDTFYPGWRAYVDGQEVEIQKSPLFFRSITVPAGEHVVTMKYQPKMLHFGGIISLLTIGFLVISAKK